MVTISEILKDAVQHDASDIIIKGGCKPFYLIRGTATPSPNYPELSHEEARQVLLEKTSQEQQAHLERERELDFSFAVEGVARFRANYYYERGILSAVLRAIGTDIRSPEVLGLPPVLKKLVMEKQGLILVTGPTGSGKTTTLAALIDYANQHRPGHIVTIEDPIEVVYKNRKSVISQREVGNDTKSFAGALRASLRQAPSIILIGEMRDRETVESALKAADTGHLVLSTLHTNDAVQTINRVLNLFPPDEQDPLRIQLANTLKACLAQRLVPRADKSERLMILDILLVTTTIKEAIQKNQLDEIYKLMADGAYEGMQSTNQALLDAYKEGIITSETALAYSPVPNDMVQRMRNVSREGR